MNDRQDWWDGEVPITHDNCDVRPDDSDAADYREWLADQDAQNEYQMWLRDLAELSATGNEQD